MGSLGFWAALFCLAAVPLARAQSITPQNYTLNIALNSTSGTFSGTVDIFALATAQNINSIQLNSSGLTVATAQILQTTQRVTSITQDTSTVTIHLNSNLLTTAPFLLSVSFNGSVSSDLSGLYTYSENNQQFFVTNLYPAYASRLFPCFDNVGSRAIFQLTLNTSFSTAISNTPIVGSPTNNGGTYTYVFSPTPSIPPSSVFFIAGSLTSSFTEANTPITVWTSPSIDAGLISSAIYSYRNSLFSSFHKVDGMPKLDIIPVSALKSETYTGYGVVAIRSDIFQNDPAKTTTAMQRQNLVAVLKALFKIFYGTLATPATWAENYISDSVALLLTYAALPTFKTSSAIKSNSADYFFTDVSEKALDLCTSGTTVISQATLSNASAIEAFVTGPSMLKGAAILEMISTVFPNVTQGLLSCYETNKQSKTGLTSVSFLNCLDSYWKSSTNTLTTMISPWLASGGCPLIATQRRENSIFVVQQQIPETSSVSSFAVTATPLIVPVTAQSNSTGFNNNAVVYSSNSFNSPTQLASTVSSNSWVVIDVDGKGYYRTQYDTSSWSLLTQSLESNISALSSASRAKIISDAFWVARDVQNSLYQTLPNSIQFLSKDSSLAPWKTAIAQLRRLWNWIYHTGYPSKNAWEQNFSLNFTNYATGLMLTTYQSLNTVPSESDSADTLTLRREIVSAMCDFNYPMCVSNIQAQFQQWLDNSIAPSEDMLSVVICNGLKSSSYNLMSNWKAIYNQLNPINYGSPQIRQELYEALACVPASNSTTGSSDSIDEFLRIVLSNSDGNFPISDVPGAFQAIYQRPEHTTQALTFLLVNQPSNLRNDLTQATQVSMLNDLAQYLTLDDQSYELNSYVRNNTNPTSFLRAVRSAQTTLNTKMNWIQAVQSYLHAGLDPNFTPPINPTSSTPTSPSGSSSAPGSSTAKPVGGKGSFTAPSLAMLIVTASLYIFKF